MKNKFSRFSREAGEMEQNPENLCMFIRLDSSTPQLQSQMMLSSATFYSIERRLRLNEIKL